MLHKNVKLKIEYAYSVLEVAMRQDQLRLFILGFPPYSISDATQNGTETECVFEKLEAIYRYYNENPHSQIEIKLEELLLQLVQRTRSFALITLIGWIEQQIVAQTEKRAPFKINTQLMLETLRDNLIQNQSLYGSEIYQRVGFWEEISGRFRRLTEFCGFADSPGLYAKWRKTKDKNTTTYRAWGYGFELVPRIYRCIAQALNLTPFMYDDPECYGEEFVCELGNGIRVVYIYGLSMIELIIDDVCVNEACKEKFLKELGLHTVED